MDILKRAWSLGFRSKGWQAGYIWLGWGVIGGLVPLWGTAFLLWLLSREIEPFGLLKNGEFVLYAASFIGGSLFTIRRDVFPNRNLLNLFFYALLGITLLTFAAITITSLGHADGRAPNLHISPTALTWISGLVFAFSTLLCLLVTVLDAAGAGLDVPERIKRNETKLEEAFAKLQSEDTSTGDGK
jgi:hypothetical protein